MNSGSNKAYKISHSIKNLLAELDDPEKRSAIERAEQVLTELDREKKRKLKWMSVGDGGTPQGLELQETRLAEIEAKIHSLHFERGDFHVDIQDTPSSGSAASMPLHPPPALGPIVPYVSDAERRLARLRELGGDVKYVKNRYKTTKIVALALSEIADGRPRISQKTIRSDLHQAFNDERESRKAVFGAGLGQK